MMIFGKITGAIIAVESDLKCFCLKCDEITGVKDESYKPISRKVLIEKSKCKKCSRIQRNYRKFVAFSPESYKKMDHFGKARRYSKMSWTTLAPEVSNFADITPRTVRSMVVSANPAYKIFTKSKVKDKPSVEIRVSNVENSVIAGGDIYDGYSLSQQTGGIVPRRRPGGPAQQNPYRWRPGGTVPHRPYMQQPPTPNPYYNSTHNQQHEALRTRYLQRIRAMSEVQRRAFLSQEVHPNWCMCQRCEGGEE